MSEQSAEQFNMGPQVEDFRESCNPAVRFDYAQTIVTELLQSDLLAVPIA